MKKRRILPVIFAVVVLASVIFALKNYLPSNNNGNNYVPAPGEFVYSEIPEYKSDAYVKVNGNTPYFSEEEITETTFENYSSLDSLGRCGVAFANICRELMPKDKREPINSVRPSGWKSSLYDFVDGQSLYNRCHLIGFQLAGENANEKNLITGTRYMNTVGMLPFENMVADYVKETGNHVLYRITPVFEGEELIARGVLMEGLSVEDKGDGICFNVFCYNVEPRIYINYNNGENYEIKTVNGKETDSAAREYVLNTYTLKFHSPDCENISDINPRNKKSQTVSREELIREGYSPCGTCKP